MKWRRGSGSQETFAAIHDTMPDADLATMFQLSVSAIERRRAALGLRKDPKLRWKRRPHPRGFTGNTHGETARMRMSTASRRAWADHLSKLNSEELKQRRSDNMATRQAKGELRAAYSRGSMGKRADLGDVYFRSSWEANYARYLNWLVGLGEIERWQYEPETFWFHAIKRGTRSYTPDFRVYERGRSYLVEVKGWMDAKSKTKLARMAKYYPEVEIRLVDEAQYKAIARAVAALIPGWETKRTARAARQPSGSSSPTSAPAPPARSPA